MSDQDAVAIISDDGMSISIRPIQIRGRTHRQIADDITGYQEVMARWQWMIMQPKRLTPNAPPDVS